nr:sigma-70 family RNA polymerase sigma factor [Saprospiraceae bacterium]
INNKKHVSADSLDNNVLTVVSDDEVDYENVKLKLSKAIDLLPHKQKIVFNLRYYDEMSYQEIANITHTSVGALKSSFHLAVKKIEDFLKKEI